MYNARKAIKRHVQKRKARDPGLYGESAVKAKRLAMARDDRANKPARSPWSRTKRRGLFHFSHRFELGKMTPAYAATTPVASGLWDSITPDIKNSVLETVAERIRMAGDALSERLSAQILRAKFAGDNGSARLLESHMAALTRSVDQQTASLSSKFDEMIRTTNAAQGKTYTEFKQGSQKFVGMDEFVTLRRDIYQLKSEVRKINDKATSSEGFPQAKTISEQIDDLAREMASLSKHSKDSGKTEEIKTTVKGLQARIDEFKRSSDATNEELSKLRKETAKNNANIGTNYDTLSARLNEWGNETNRAFDERLKAIENNNNRMIGEIGNSVARVDDRLDADIQRRERQMDAFRANIQTDRENDMRAIQKVRMQNEANLRGELDDRFKSIEDRFGREMDEMAAEFKSLRNQDRTQIESAVRDSVQALDGIRTAQRRGDDVRQEVNDLWASLRGAQQAILDTQNTTGQNFESTWNQYEQLIQQLNEYRERQDEGNAQTEQTLKRLTDTLNHAEAALTAFVPREQTSVPAPAPDSTDGSGQPDAIPAIEYEGPSVRDAELLDAKQTVRDMRYDDTQNARGVLGEQIERSTGEVTKLMSEKVNQLNALFFAETVKRSQAEKALSTSKQFESLNRTLFAYSNIISEIQNEFKLINTRFDEWASYVHGGTNDISTLPRTPDELTTVLTDIVKEKHAMIDHITKYDSFEAKKAITRMENSATVNAKLNDQALFEKLAPENVMALGNGLRNMDGGGDMFRYIIPDGHEQKYMNEYGVRENEDVENARAQDYEHWEEGDAENVFHPNAFGDDQSEYDQSGFAEEMDEGGV